MDDKIGSPVSRLRWFLRLGATQEQFREERKRDEVDMKMNCTLEVWICQ